jgi:hypothetical protein
MASTIVGMKVEQHLLALGAGQRLQRLECRIEQGPLSQTWDSPP